MSGAVRDALRLFRAQTAAVEGAGFPLAAWIGGAPIWTLPLFALLGIVCHFGGFGENSITDLDYDRCDPSKADHPVVAGRMSVAAAGALVYSCQALGILLFALVLSAARPAAGVALPVALLVGYIALGHAYNLVGKRSKPLAVLEISGAFGLAFLAMGSAWTGSTSVLVWAVGVYGAVFTAFQIAVAGELKEIAQGGEANILRRLGARVESPFGSLAGAISALEGAGAARVTGDRSMAGDWLWPSRGAWALAYGLSAGKAAAVGAVAWEVGGPLWGLLVAWVSFVLFATYSARLLWPGTFDRPRRVRLMGLGEAGSYLVLVAALAPVLGPWLLAGLLVLPVLWFVGLNHILWGTLFAPRV